MYNNFNITDKEREQIMEQHSSHGYKKGTLLNEEVSKEEIINYFGLTKEFEKTLDNGSVINGYSILDKIYSVKVIIMGDKAKIIYDGPVFGNPNKKSTVDLTVQFFQKDWIPVTGSKMFPIGIEKALNHAKLIKQYNNSPSLK